MSARLVRQVLVLATAASVAVLGAGPAASGAGPAQAADGSLHGVAFQVVAEAYPTEPAPGRGSEAVAVRPHASFSEVSNPPASAYARAVQSDLGLAEAYFGQQGPRAEADTTVDDSESDVLVEEQGSTLRASVTLDPSAEAAASGAGEGGSSGSSATRAELVDGALLATARAEVDNATAGPVLIGHGVFEAQARVDGTIEGAFGDGRIVLSDTTVDGIPVVVGSNGVEVDETQVPTEFVPAATAQIQEWFSQGGYADVRVVQPEVEISDDGRHVKVSGGGVSVFFTNNDPSDLYFLSYKLLGGLVSADLGVEIGTIGPPVTLPPPTTTTTTTTTRPPEPEVGAVAPPETTTTLPPLVVDDAVEVAYVDDAETLELRGIWPGWVWVVGAVTALAGAAIGATRVERVRALGRAVGDGYLRG